MKVEQVEYSEDPEREKNQVQEFADSPEEYLEQKISPYEHVLKIVGDFWDD